MGGNACFNAIIKLSTSLQGSYCLCYTILCTAIASYVPRGKSCMEAWIIHATLSMAEAWTQIVTKLYRLYSECWYGIGPI